MKSITIHGVDDELDKLIRQKADAFGASINRTIKRLLKDSLGIGGQKKTKKEDFSEFFGAWTKKEAEEFERNTADFEKIDKEDWK